MESTTTSSGITSSTCCNAIAGPMCRGIQWKLTEASIQPDGRRINGNALAEEEKEVAPLIVAAHDLSFCNEWFAELERSYRNPALQDATLFFLLLCLPVALLVRRPRRLPSCMQKGDFTLPHIPHIYLVDTSSTCLQSAAPARRWSHQDTKRRAAHSTPHDAY